MSEQLADAMERLGRRILELESKIGAAEAGLCSIRDFCGELDPEKTAVEDAALGAYFLARDTLAAMGLDARWQKAADEQIEAAKGFQRANGPEYDDER